MMDRTRFKSAIWYKENNEKNEVLIGGAGGIGSWLAFFLQRSGQQVALVDFDDVESSNLGGQLFALADVDDTKVGAISDTIYSFTGEFINGYNKKIEEFLDFQSFEFFFGAFDKITPRRYLFDKWVDNAHKHKILIDGRLEAETFQIFCIRDMEESNYNALQTYEKYGLPAEDSVPNLSCSFKQTSHVAAAVASHMTSLFTNHLSNIVLGKEVMKVPFYTEFTVNNQNFQSLTLKQYNDKKQKRSNSESIFTQEL